MRERDKLDALSVLEAQRSGLSDPFAAFSSKQATPRVRRTPWVAITGVGLPALAAAALIAVLVNPFAAILPEAGADLAWSAVIDDLWVAEVLVHDEVLLAENSWNLLDLGDDQGI